MGYIQGREFYCVVLHSGIWPLCLFVYPEINFFPDCKSGNLAFLLWIQKIQRVSCFHTVMAVLLLYVYDGTEFMVQTYTTTCSTTIQHSAAGSLTIWKDTLPSFQIARLAKSPSARSLLLLALSLQHLAIWLNFYFWVYPMGASKNKIFCFDQLWAVVKCRALFRCSHWPLKCGARKFIVSEYTHFNDWWPTALSTVKYWP